ncbi:MAG: hypothetical protein IPF54_24335 [Draconibacterium sp.]|nr:hypothetical protein [Draconibacterium sp.]
MWNPPGSSCAGINQGMKAISPDGLYSFEMMPNYMWSLPPISNWHNLTNGNNIPNTVRLRAQMQILFISQFCTQ